MNTLTYYILYNTTNELTKYTLACRICHHNGLETFDSGHRAGNPQTVSSLGSLRAKEFGELLFHPGGLS